jgi:hypothetical protein
MSYLRDDFPEVPFNFCRYGIPVLMLALGREILKILYRSFRVFNLHVPRNDRSAVSTSFSVATPLF